MTGSVGVGDTIAGKYRVERVLGQGGMGVVVAARHLTLGEPVAIKFPLPRAFAQEGAVARIVREGRLAARIRSEHVARVYDIGTLDTGEPYLVLEYLRGTDLGTLVRANGPLPVGSAVEYVLQACEGLAEAHARGVVHRDIKPSNLFLTRRTDGSPLVKVIDFGVSKDARTSAPELQLTGSAVALGSPLYMSPEQMRSARDVDARTDLWSLGAVLYCLLTGSAPFDAASIPEIHELVLAGAPRLSKVLPDAPLALELVVLRCLERDPARRYADVAELAAALAPHGPAHARASADRAMRVLRAPPEPAEGASVEPGPPPDGPSTGPWTDASESGVVAEPAAPAKARTGEPNESEGEEREAPGDLASTGTPRDASWLGTRGAGADRSAAPEVAPRPAVGRASRVPALTLAVLLAGLLGGLGVLAALRRGPADVRPAPETRGADPVTSATSRAEPPPPPLSEGGSAPVPEVRPAAETPGGGDAGAPAEGRPPAPQGASVAPSSREPAPRPAVKRPGRRRDPLADPD